MTPEPATDAKQPFTITVPSFDGPFDLLLHLIEREELDITAISLAQVTDQYLAQVEELKQNRLSELIDFIVIGARLMVIKSRALLPTPPIVLEGEEEEDPAETLIRQLKRYRQFKRSADWLQKRESADLRSYLRVVPPPKVESKLDLSGVSAETLHAAMLTVLIRLANRQESVSVARKRTLTIEGQIDKLRRTVRSHRTFPFTALLSESPNSAELSVSLLAVLEMIKRREVEASQALLFGPIEINRAS